MFVFDNFLDDEALRAELHDEAAWAGMPDYNWWDGWWTRPAANPQERLIQAVWGNQGVAGRVAGFEYWYNRLTPESVSKWHRDCDEKLRVADRRYECPRLGQIYYVRIDGLSGGILEISAADTLNEVEFGDLERIRAVENRLIVFDPSCWHRVTRLQSGLRLSLLSNVWTERPRTFELGDHVDGTFQPVDWRAGGQRQTEGM